MFELTGKKAIVTGASSGLGVQFALALARQGADVALLARRLDRLEAVKAQIMALGRQCLAIKCDVSVETEVQAAVAQVNQAFGRIDILANNAGVSAIAPAEQMTEADWDKVIDIDLKAVWLMAKHVGQYMINQGYGKIINTSSIFGLVGNSSFPVVAYHAAKFGVVGLTKALAGEWAKHNITVNAIGPGFFDSEMTHAVIETPDFNQYVAAGCPMKRIGREGELDGAMIYFASDASSYTTGQIIAVDGGWTSI
ncbi:MAG TPA: short-chain dehydrogenase [Candidatus Pacebacteria bacterium]|nr:short-chain dehydrogenase [Candidatus Paceibacterota bacterium]